MKTLGVIAILSVVGASLAPQEPAGKTAAPSAQQETFATSLKAGEIEKAYERLFKGTRFEADLPAMIEQTEKGLKTYGGVAAWDNLGVIRQDKHQSLGIVTLCCDEAPLNFYFQWYRKTETGPWKLQAVWFSDAVKDYWAIRK